MISIRQYFSTTKSRSICDPMRFVDDVYRYSLARGLTSEDAEDIAIESAQQAPTKSDPADLRTYMIGMARRKIANHYRKNREIDAFEDTAVRTSVDQKIDVERALSTISDSHRECLVLKYVNGLTSEEIATVMESTPEAVDSLLQRARKSFAKEWEVMHGEENGR